MDFSQLIAYARTLGDKTDILQLAILVLGAWFWFRSKAIAALQESAKETEARTKALEEKVRRFERLFRRFGCAAAVGCDGRVPFSDIDLLVSEIGIGGTDCD